MVDLNIATVDCFAGLGLPASHGQATLAPVEHASITSVAPFRGKRGACDAALKKAVGAALSETGRVLSGKDKDLRVLWTGQGQWFVVSTTADAGNVTSKAVKDLAAITDQSDAWACMALTGEGASDVLARLCPIDPDVLLPGTTVRSEFAHMMGVVTPIEDGYEIMVMRSFIGTAVHHTLDAMRSLAAQRKIR